VKNSSNNQQELDYTQWFSEQYNIGLKQILKFSFRNPGMAWFMVGEIVRFYFADRRRKKFAKQSVKVPPMLIYSVTAECNLNCHGCYARLLHSPKNGEFDAKQFEDVIRQADEIGVSYILVAGGEPFSRPELLNVTAKHPSILFTPFTNGLLVTDEHIKKLKKQKHVLPIVSFEGYEFETDKRRGQGVYENGLELLEKFRKQGIFYGVSITATRDNLDLISDEAFINKLAKLGCRIFFFINYIPVEKGTEEMVMKKEQFDKLNKIMALYRQKYEALFLAFPGSELDFGGCLAAGKGFVHINAEGDVQPCPFSPYSDVSLKEMSLSEALKSPLLKTIRDAGLRLDESNGVCALWQNRAWVASLIEDEKKPPN
jgi:MoaA/NifB/PqqE/SkfB family radical SAM enzyme